MRLSGTVALVVILGSLPVEAQTCQPGPSPTRFATYGSTGCSGISLAPHLATPCLAGQTVGLGTVLGPCEGALWSCDGGTQVGYEKYVFATPGYYHALARVYSPFLEYPITLGVSIPVVYGYAIGGWSAAEGPDPRATIKILRGAAPETTSTVEYATSDETAKAGVHYVATSGTLTFAPGESEKVVTVPLIQDDLYLQTAFRFTLSHPSMGQIVGNATESIPIVDDEPPPQVAFEKLEYSAAEGGTVSVTLVRTGSMNPPLSVWLGGSRTRDTRVDFAPYETQKTIDVLIVENTCFDGDHQGYLELSPDERGTPGRRLATVAIADNEQRPALSIDDVSVVEGGYAAVRVTLSGFFCHAFSVRMRTFDGTAVAGADYHAHDEQVQGLLVVPAHEDELMEPDETFFVEATPQINRSYPDETPVLVRNRATVTILNDDAPAAVVSVTPDRETAIERTNVVFRTTFSIPVTGVDRTDFLLVEEGLQGSQVIAVDGTASEYRVTVRMGMHTGEGGAASAALRVLDDDTIVDELGGPLGGWGPDNGGMTSAPVGVLWAAVAPTLDDVFLILLTVTIAAVAYRRLTAL